MPDPLLDVGLIARRRTELGMSQRSLGRELALTPVAISLLERGGNHEELTLRSLARLAKTLALPLRALIAAPVGDGNVGELGPRGDDLIVETLLASARQAVESKTIAIILHWDLARAGAALGALGRRLEGTGVVLHRASSGYMIRPRGDVLRDDELKELERVRMRTRQIRETGMRLLLEIVRRGLPGDWERHAGNNDRVNLRMLLNAGVVTRTSDGYRAAPELLTSLRLPR